MQNANPEHLDQLADLLAGKRGGSLSNGLDEAFRRASALGVSERLAPLKPMRTWTSDTAPDLRRRATVLRLENGDPQAGLKWAGFTPEELQAQPGLAQHPIVLLLSNAVASSKWVAESYYFHRKPNESLDDWVKRLEGKSVSKVVGGDPKNWTTLLADVSDARSILDAGSVAFVQGGALTLTLGGNYLKKAFDESVRVTRIRNALGAKATQWLAHSNIFVRGLGWGTQKVADFRFPIRSLSAPGA
ncbi:hypothetical protein B7P34_19940 [Streptosporangium nondiastaticum]|uniref:Uncharacterized protein n=1 Tax=Streptosporangium nondiastaticum TaxID=35764 RepID=A0A9X7JP10_9ACTN|nr:hypothetical protein [Streptosporangium nondiastaticum]PSJ27001.1 hypothetical protein B7P34_19940 [Streptosporangium nondiastaticum]